jgi:subfamily B ATP-binding cassette protein MsbA
MDDEVQEYTPTQVYQRLWRYTRRYWVMFAIGIIGVSLDAAMQAAFIKFIEPLIDRVFVAKDAAFGLYLAGLIMGVVVLRVIGHFAGAWGMEWTGRRVVADLRAELFDGYLGMPATFYDRFNAGQLISKLTYNSEQVANAATDAIIAVARDVMLLFYLLILMLSLNVKLTASMLLLAPAVAIVVSVVSRRFRRISRRIQDSMGEVAHVTEEAVVGQRVVKVFQGEAQERERFAAANERNRRLHMRMVATHMTSSSLVQISAGIALVVLMVIATRPSMLAEISAGTFTSLFFAMVATIPPLKRLTGVQSKVQKGIAAAESNFRVVDTEREHDEGTQAVVRVRGELEFRNLSFSYANAEGATLKDISFTVPAGSVTALVGRSGSGKTTLASLLPRFYGYHQGHVLLDGVEVSDYRLSDLRRQIALVSQDVVLFNGSVSENIAYGALAGASSEAIEDAARAAHAMEFIERLPEGMDTLVGEGGTRLSGGQRQRIAIARALLKDAPVLILDEATSALDSESERAIQEALQVVMKDRTTLVIAHRLSTIENADQVVVLEDGAVIELGTHAELLTRGQAYAVLYQVQFGEEA